MYPRRHLADSCGWLGSGRKNARRKNCDGVKGSNRLDLRDELTAGGVRHDNSRAEFRGSAPPARSRHVRVGARPATLDERGRKGVLGCCVSNDGHLGRYRHFLRGLVLVGLRVQ